MKKPLERLKNQLQEVYDLIDIVNSREKGIEGLFSFSGEGCSFSVDLFRAKKGNYKAYANEIHYDITKLEASQGKGYENQKYFIEEIDTKMVALINALNTHQARSASEKNVKESIRQLIEKQRSPLWDVKERLERQLKNIIRQEQNLDADILEKRNELLRNGEILSPEEHELLSKKILKLGNEKGELLKSITRLKERIAHISTKINQSSKRPS